MDSVELVYQWSNQLLNKEQSGELSPDSYNVCIDIVSKEMTKLKLGLPEDYTVEVRKSRQQFEANQNSSDALRRFITQKTITKVGNGFPIPTDFAAFAENGYLYVAQEDGQNVITKEPIEFVTVSERGLRLNNYIKKPTLQYPIGSYMDNKLIVDPSDITNIQLNYVRYPRTPFRNYTINSNDQDVYEPIGSVQIEWDELLLPDFAIRVARYFGVTIREDAFINYALQRQIAGQ